MDRLFCVLIFMDDWTDLFKKIPYSLPGKYTPENAIPKGHNGIARQDSEDSAFKLREKRFAKLRHKALYINLEHEDVMDTFKHAQSLFISTMFKYCHQHSLDAPFEPVPQGCSPNSGLSLDSQESKELYRKIAKKTHPDTMHGLSEEEMEERASLYQEATEGKKEGDIHKILNVALQLNISVETLTSEFLDQIEVAAHQLESKINRIKKDIMWNWYYASPEEQEEIFKQLTKK